MNMLVMLAMLGAPAGNDSQRMATVIAQEIIQEDRDFPQDMQLNALEVRSVARFAEMEGE